jgi:hypothetical protein
VSLLILGQARLDAPGQESRMIGSDRSSIHRSSRAGM